MNDIDKEEAIRKGKLALFYSLNGEIIVSDRNFVIVKYRNKFYKIRKKRITEFLFWEPKELTKDEILTEIL